MSMSRFTFSTETARVAQFELKMTQLEVADHTRSDKRTLLNIEYYKNNPEMEIPWSLLRALGIDAYIALYPKAMI